MSYDGNNDSMWKLNLTAAAGRKSGIEIVPARRSAASYEGVARVPQRRLSRLGAYAVAGGIATAAIGAGVRPWLQPRNVEATGVHEESNTARQVATARPERQAVSEVTLPATVEAYQSARLFSRVAGYVKAWHAEIGQNVKAGDVLAEIDTPELDQELMQSRANLGIANAAVVQSQAELTEAVAALEQAKADRARSQADVELANTRLRRRETLLGKQAATQEEYETAVRDRDARQAEVTAAGATINRQTAAVGTQQAVIESRKAAVESAEANVRRLEELQSFQRITAPFDGVVTQRIAEVGMLVTAGGSTPSDALYHLAQIDRVRVQVAVPQSEAAGVSAGTSVVVRIPERPDQAVAASVTRTSRSVDPATRTLLAEIEIQNPLERFSPGVYAEVAVQTRSPESTWLIPTNTVRMQVDGPHVVLASDAGRLEVRPVRLGRDFGRSVAVVNGVTGSEQLVVNPTDDLRDGMPVSVEQPASSSAVAVR